MVYIYQEKTGNIRITCTPRDQTRIGEDEITLLYTLPADTISLKLSSILRPWLDLGNPGYYRPSFSDHLDEIINLLQSPSFQYLRKLDNPGDRLREFVRTGKLLEIIPADWSFKESEASKVEYDSDILGVLVYSECPAVNKSGYDKILEFINLENDLRRIVTSFFRQQSRSKREDFLRYRVDPNHLSRVLRFVPSHYKYSRELFRNMSGKKAERISPVSFCNTCQIFPESTEDDLTRAIYSNFKYREELLGPEIKRRLGEIYESLGITRTPKVVDLNEYFEIVPYRARGERGYRIENHLKIIF